MKNSHNKKIDEEHHGRPEIDKSDFGKNSFYHVKFSHQQSCPLYRDSRDSPCLGMKFSFEIVSSKYKQICYSLRTRSV